MEEYKKGSFICSRENPLHKQLNVQDYFNDLRIEGFLGAEDLLLLTKKSNSSKKQGCLKRLDMSGVTEMDTEELKEGFFGAWEDNIAFCRSDLLEEVILPSVETIDIPMFLECRNLRKVVIPQTLKKLLAGILSSCPNIEEIYVASDLDLLTYPDWRTENSSCYSFIGSGKRFVSDNEGWPDKDCRRCFFVYDGVLYHKSFNDITLYRYPSGDERTEFVIPEGVTEICLNSFCENHHLRKVTIPKSVKRFDKLSFENCSALETIIFKNESIRACSSGYAGCYVTPMGDGTVVNGSSNLKHIYLYAENPEGVEGVVVMFGGLGKLGEMILHVPCSCKKIYEDYEIKWSSSRGDISYEKSFLKFHHIEEFDPSDLHN